MFDKLEETADRLEAAQEKADKANKELQEAKNAHAQKQIEVQKELYDEYGRLLRPVYPQPYNPTDYWPKPYLPVWIAPLWEKRITWTSDNTSNTRR